MDAVRDLRRRAGLTQSKLASAAGTSQPTIAAYESGAKSPTLRTLERLAESVGFEAIVNFVAPLTREDRRSLALHRAIADRLASEPNPIIVRARRNLARMRDAHPGARRLLDEWRRALDGPVEDLLELLVDPRPHARDLRQVTPFAGVLQPTERWAIQRTLRETA